jgi:DNA-binding NarL/FixJ family response regulator
MGQLLDDDHRFRLVGVVGTREQAVLEARRHAPDVVLVAQQLEGVRGVDLCADLRRAAPSAALLLWSHGAGARSTGEDSPDVDAVIERGMTYRELAWAVRTSHLVRREPRVVDLTDPIQAARPA